jgi:TIR domain
MDDAGERGDRRLIFISYRRDDSAGHAGRLFDTLKERLPAAEVYMDLDAIPPGALFAEHIKKALDRSAVMLALIGPDWLGPRGRRGRRLEQAEDYVRQELEMGLRRDLLPVPVLLRGAQLPALAKLPESVRPLLRRNAIELSDSRWSYDVDRLIALIAARVGVPQDGPGPAPGSVPGAVRAATGPRTNLPELASSFIGREADVGAVTVLIGQHRLVTQTRASACSLRPAMPSICRMRSRPSLTSRPATATPSALFGCSAPPGSSARGTNCRSSARWRRMSRTSSAERAS